MFDPERQFNSKPETPAESSMDFNDFRNKRKNEIDFEKLLARRERIKKLAQKQFEEEGWLSPKELLEQADKNNKAEIILERIMNRAGKNVQYVKDLKNIGLLNPIIYGELGKLPGVQFNKPSKNRDGLYRPALNNISIKGNVPETRQILESLVNFGMLPHNIDVLVHEWTHKNQFPKSLTKRLFHTLKPFNTELLESQAFKSGPLELSTIDLIERLNENGYKINMDKAIYASRAVDQLRALGYAPADISSIIQDAGSWNKDRAEYPKIQEIIESKAKESGADNFDLENLVLAYKINREIGRYRLAVIALEELRRSFLEDKIKNEANQ